MHDAPVPQHVRERERAGGTHGRVEARAVRRPGDAVGGPDRGRPRGRRAARRRAPSPSGARVGPCSASARPAAARPARSRESHGSRSPSAGGTLDRAAPALARALAREDRTRASGSAAGSRTIESRRRARCSTRSRPSGSVSVTSSGSSRGGRVGAPEKTISAREPVHPRRSARSGRAAVAATTDPPRSRRRRRARTSTTRSSPPSTPLAGKQASLELDRSRGTLAPRLARTDPPARSPSADDRERRRAERPGGDEGDEPERDGPGASPPHTGDGRALECLAHDVGRPEPCRARLGREQQPVREHGLRHLANVVRRDVLAPLDERARLREPQERDPRARARAEREVRIRRACAGGARRRSASRSPRRRSRGCRDDRLDDLCAARRPAPSAVERRLARLLGEHPGLLRQRRVADRHPHGEAVELCLGQRVRALVLDRVLRRDRRETGARAGRSRRRP